VELGIARATGTSLTIKIAVATDTMAVTLLVVPRSQYAGYHRVMTSSAWVSPQATMKVPNYQNIQLNGRSFLLRAM
jgi:hypothetical protein